MSETTLIYILAGISAVTLILAVVLAALLGSARRDIREERRDMTQRIDSMQALLDSKLTELREDNNAQLERMRRTVDEKLDETLDRRLSRSFESVRRSLDEVYKGLGEMHGLAQGVGDLKKVLTNVKTRGILGELQLGAILEQILAKEQYLTDTPVVPGSTERVEFAVKLPGDGETPMLLAIDSKFPGDVYSDLMDAYDSGDAATVSECRKTLAMALKKCAKDISDKYIKPPYTTDFAVMFLPFEGLYAEAVNMGAIEVLQERYHVMVAGPSTTAALLSSLQMGFRTLAIQKNASQVWKVLGNVKREFDKFGEVLEAAQQRINQANTELDRLIGTRTRMIQRSLKDVQRLGEMYPAGLTDDDSPQC